MRPAGQDTIGVRLQHVSEDESPSCPSSLGSNILAEELQAMQLSCQVQVEANAKLLAAIASEDVGFMEVSVCVVWMWLLFVLGRGK